MASTFRGLETGKSGLSSAMLHLEIAGQNIANANTPGYTRQRVNSAAKPPAGADYVVSQLFNKRVGLGVETVDIEQIRSEYLDLQFRDLSTDFNYYEFRSQGMHYLTGVLNELSDTASITLALNDFVGAMSKLAEDPSSEELRLNLQQNAIGLTDTINYVYDQMTDLAESQKDSVGAVVTDINAKLEQIANLNKAISKYERGGLKALELRDQRNLLLDELAGLVNIDYDITDSNASMIDVYIGDVQVIKEDQFAHIDYSDEHTVADPDTGVKPYELTLDAQWMAEPVVIQSKYCTQTDYTANQQWEPKHVIRGGELFAHMEMLQNPGEVSSGIPYYVNKLNELAQNIAKTINDVHTQGYSYPDAENGNLSVKGIDFFEVAQVPVYELDANGEKRPIYATDADDNRIPVYKVDSQGNQLLDENGDPVIMRDPVTNEIIYERVYDEDGNPAYVQATDANGDPLFEPDYTAINGANFSVSEKVLESVWNIAASSGPVNPDDFVNPNTGNSENLVNMQWEFEHADIYGQLNTFVTQLAIDADSSDKLLDTAESLLNSVDTQRQSLSSVSVDEETTNLIMYRQNYNAAARLITSIDEMLDKLVNGTGRVGL